MALNSEHTGTPLTSVSEGSDDLTSSLARLQEKIKKIARAELKPLLRELLVEKRALKVPNAQSAGNSTTVGDPPVAATQSLLLEPPSSSARPFVDLTPGCSSQGSRIMTLKFPFSLPVFAGTGKQDFREWIDLFDRAMLACGDLSGGERLRYMGVFLEGPAYRVLRGCGANTTYDSVVSALKETFLSPEESRIAAV
ncbi:MAG: hypothetical protein GY696_07460, partial [Gammaproteobacteria bacterium]|nr:hypothetical protein [Gammaproteobacteria bacterium]